MTLVTNAKGRALRFREMVLLSLQVAGVSGITQKREFKKMSERLLAAEAHSDIQGLDQWAVLTRIEHTRDTSGALDQAGEAARLDGKTKSAVIWYRSGREASEQYVIMPLSSFAEVLVAEQGRTP